MTELFRYAASARRTVTAIVVAAVLAAALLQGYASLPPWGAAPVAVVVAPGSSVRDIGETLARAGVVRSTAAFAIAVALSGTESTLVAGTYAFETPESLTAVVRRLRAGDTRVPMSAVTLPEGMTRKEMAKALAAALPNFDAAAFMRTTESEEGYLFPDTYRFDRSADAEAVAETLRGNFRRRTDTLSAALATSGRTLDEAVKMASIVEEEATADSRAIVAGILWARLDEGMPLQVDAPFVYAIGKATKDLTQDDLAKDGPYNTYVRKGLPPTPICNPGLAAIQAALAPTKTPYRFFLTGRDGKMHFAKTFAEHQVNRERYL